jgi:hypothetical protein
MSEKVAAGVAPHRPQGLGCRSGRPPRPRCGRSRHGVGLRLAAVANRLETLDVGEQLAAVPAAAARGAPTLPACVCSVRSVLGPASAPPAGARCSACAPRGAPAWRARPVRHLRGNPPAEHEHGVVLRVTDGARPLLRAAGERGRRGRRRRAARGHLRQVLAKKTRRSPPKRTKAPIRGSIA